MKINYNQKQNIVKFNSLSYGSCFEYYGCFYIKTPTREVVRNCGMVVQYNAVMLNYGSYEWVDDDEDVIYYKDAEIELNDNMVSDYRLASN